MLTADLAMSWRRGRRVGPRHIDTEDSKYLRVAEDLISIVRRHRGRRRAELEQALNDYVGVGTDYKILRGLIKLIADRCSFETTSPVDPAEIRRILFLKARLRHPVSESATVRQEVLDEAAKETGCSAQDLIENLYGDLAENQELIDFEEPSAVQLLDRYNLAQAQALLYRSVEMRLWVEAQEAAGYRQLFDAIKAYRLIHTIQGNPHSGYEIRLSGPISMFHRSQKYGIQMAVFLPALIACRGWRMQAEIALKPSGTAFFEMSSKESRLRSDYSIEAADQNPLAEKLIMNWDKLSSDWSMEPSKQIIALGESAFIPDLLIHHPSGKKVFLELVGFWTPRYLEERLKEFHRGGFKNFLLAVSEEMRCSREAPSKPPLNVIVYKTTLSPDAIEEAVGRLAQEEDINHR